jgi:ferredoxin
MRPQPETSTLARSARVNRVDFDELRNVERADLEEDSRMGMYIIAEPCIGTKDTACVEVCPVDCIHPKKDEDGFADATQLYIDPNVCIQCGNCEPACPVKAIFTEETIPDQWKHYLQINADHFA